MAILIYNENPYTWCVKSWVFILKQGPGIILCMRPTNERRRYNVTSSLIGRAHTQNDPWGTRIVSHYTSMTPLLAS